MILVHSKRIIISRAGIHRSTQQHQRQGADDDENRRIYASEKHIDEKGTNRERERENDDDGVCLCSSFYVYQFCGWLFLVAYHNRSILGDLFQ
jgi:hypothetical protein